jgi:hypothetical protein
MVREAKARVHAAAPAAAPPAAAEPAPAAEPAADAAPVPPSAAPAPSTKQDRLRAAWAGAMNFVAEEFTAGLKDLPPGERWKEQQRIKALTTTAGQLASGTAPPAVPAMAAE